MITSTGKLTGKDDITNLDIQHMEDVNSLKHGEVAVGNWGSETKREFKSRHLSMLAVGGTIGRHCNVAAICIQNSISLWALLYVSGGNITIDLDVFK
ncbi:hypothetical protein BOTCAL_0494g00050 [Botryotinia calthae]|uniref:Uncharacterized protein n=1 Tax=Botryotinia calthae TaxID=38488 RepID=A0A4Y8CLJ3_9HELO|nr:hypothetical protein BOTCAL_0494g00050 [Botryotinia calthae]